jgi:hypothetical protein
MKKIFLSALLMAAGFNAAAGSMSWNGISFDVMSTRMAYDNQLRIVARGLENGTQTENVVVDGTVTGQHLADLDHNGFPELYITTQSAGSGSYGNIIGYAVNNGKSITPIYLPELRFDGYMGHDRFVIEKSAIKRTFPVYLKGDSNARPTGGMHTVVYKLVAGEAGWILRPQ